MEIIARGYRILGDFHIMGVICIPCAVGRHLLMWCEQSDCLQTIPTFDIGEALTQAIPEAKTENLGVGNFDDTV